MWCQEEPANMGAWSFVFPKLVSIHEELERRQVLPVYVGRAEAASPATGLYKIHVKEQAALAERARASGPLAGRRGAAKKKGRGN